MDAAPALGTPAQSLVFSRARDERVVWLLTTHPVTAGMLADIGWFPTRAKALKRLRRLAVRRKVRLVGTLAVKAGRPEHVFCRWRPKADDIAHEVELTRLCFRLDAARILRGPHVTDDRTRPDAEVWVRGRCYYLELDRGSMGYAQMAGRFRLYERCEHFVLWVCPTAGRRDGLRARAQGIRSTALFTTFEEALATPHGSIWLDAAGNRAHLPRETRSTGNRAE